MLVPKTRVFGCSTKWADKRDMAKKSIEKWNAEPVELEQINASGLQKLVANKTENFLLINLWSTTCAPCISELSEFVTVNRMYRRRHFEMVTLSTDPPEQQDAALKILQKNHVSCTNYIFDTDDRDELAEALDSKWEGPVPYTLLIAPGGNGRVGTQTTPSAAFEVFTDFVSRVSITPGPPPPPRPDDG